MAFLTNVLLLLSNLQVDNVLILAFEELLELFELRLVVFDFVHKFHEVLDLYFIITILREANQVSLK
jgi:DNA phosphorothioation-dependent restriction protein DptG